MEDNNRKIQEMQILEQNLQNLLMQKQAFEMEVSETAGALKELENANDETFKVIGQIMIKTPKSKIKEELENKKKLLELRTKTISDQEEKLSKELEKIREELLSDTKKKE